MTEEHIQSAAGRRAIVTRICATKQLSSDFYGTLPMTPIQSERGRFMVRNSERRRVSQNVYNLQNLVDRMSNLQDLIAIALELEKS